VSGNIINPLPDAAYLKGRLRRLRRRSPKARASSVHMHAGQLATLAIVRLPRNFHHVRGMAVESASTYASCFEKIGGINRIDLRRELTTIDL